MIVYMEGFEGEASWEEENDQVFYDKVGFANVSHPTVPSFCARALI